MGAMANCVLAVTIVLLSACGPTPEQQAAMAAAQRADDQNRCIGYGFAPSTDAFASCMMNTLLSGMPSRLPIGGRPPHSRLQPTVRTRPSRPGRTRQTGTPGTERPTRAPTAIIRLAPRPIRRRNSPLRRPRPPWTPSATLSRMTWTGWNTPGRYRNEPRLALGATLIFLAGCDMSSLPHGNLGMPDMSGGPESPAASSMTRITRIQIRTVLQTMRARTTSSTSRISSITAAPI